MSSANFEPVMEVVRVPGTISGPGVIDDLCNRIADQLAHDCNLRQSDSYRGYSFKATIEIQLEDVYPVAISATVTMGAFNPQLPSRRMALGSEVSGEMPDSSRLERPVDETGFVPPAAVPRRYYQPTGNPRGRPKGSVKEKR